MSLFSGAGGMDVGLERAGWRTVAATDINADCMATLEASKEAGIPLCKAGDRTYLSDASLLKGDIRDLSAKDLRPKGAPKSWRPALLAGGPPCQPWSSAGLQKGLEDDRGQLLHQMVKLTEQLRPHLVLFENVRGLVTAIGPNGRPGGMIDLIKNAFEDLGYATTFATLNAANFGAAQRRVRLYMMATDRHGLPSFPEPTHSRVAGDALFSDLKPWVTLREVIESLPAPDPADIVRPSTALREQELAGLTPGTGLRTGGKVENNRPSGHWGYRQDGFLADLGLPSRTIRAAATPDWIRLPDGCHRRLTWRECAALQGFPSEWKFQGKATSKFRQIGNAVQADMIEVLGHALMASWTRGRQRIRPTSALLPDEFRKRIDYTVAEHRTNGEHRVRVRASLT
ncbi:DNA cytosine methyltransferase [Phytohabitans suffuscus]|uniref:DNA (cytosine-5-)-methyltransferase n=1 Tax=Phytohabitans suffuscus TaxID=624315 RepID=A0A6F8YI16_9ACTN|nr:DNA (cytosine-5-)-methyltransferase [Phytohabitans suffuscus]BCB85730.1 cytosine-specific methyltransferase [Phytohabitans suffuscus]